MKVKKILICSLVVMLLLVGCANNSKNTSIDEGKEVTLNVAYQYSLGYAPVAIAKEKGFIEKAYEETTGEKLVIEWIQMSNGADINTGITSGNIDVGFMGIPPAITGVTKGLGYKIFSGVSGQANSLTTNNAKIKTLEDLIGSEHQIAIVNIGSTQHIMLAMALAEYGYDAHILDSNIAVMKHPDGMVALESGNVACHLTCSPYIEMERKNEKIYELSEIEEVWSSQRSMIVGVASEQLYSEDRALYDALCQGIKSAVDFINNDIEGAASITHEFHGNSIEDEIEYLKNGSYSIETKEIFELAQFMTENGFLEATVDKYEDLVFDNVKGD